MKKVFCLILILFLVFLIPVTVFAHPGGTDGTGGHTNHSTGDYHYHHGYPEHDHYDIDGDGTADCPYDFKDRTIPKIGTSSSTIAVSQPSSSSTVTTTTTDAQAYTIPKAYEKEESGDNMSAAGYIGISILAVFAFALFIICKEKDNRIESMTMEMNRILRESDAKRKKSEAELKAQSDHFNEILQKLQGDLNEAYRELELIPKLKVELNEAHIEMELIPKLKEELSETKRDMALIKDENVAISENLKLAEKKKRDSETELKIIRGNVPPYISFAADGMPVYWKYNKDKPYGDFTVYLNRKKEIYHFDYYCASYSSEITHLFKVLKCARPCQKCSFRNHEITEIPYWYDEDNTSLDK